MFRVQDILKEIMVEVNEKRIAKLLVVIILSSIVCGYGAGFFIYRQHKEKIAYFDKQTRFASDKFAELEDNLKDVYTALENTLDENKIERKELLLKVGSIKEAIGDWQEGYRVAISTLKAEVKNLRVGKLTRMVENMQSDIDGFKMKVQDLELKLDDAKGNVLGASRDVSLGKISVRR